MKGGEEGRRFFSPLNKNFFLIHLPSPSSTPQLNLTFYNPSVVIISNMLTQIQDVDVKTLAEVYDEDNIDSFVSLYLNFDDTNLIKHREKACRTALKTWKKEALENFNKTMGIIEEYLQNEPKERGQKGWIIFASHLNNFFNAYKTDFEVESRLIVDTSPYISPLMQLLDEYEPFGLILLDTHRAVVYVVNHDRVKTSKHLSKDIMNRHRKGGCSQARFQRLRRGAINAFFKEVSESSEHLLSEVKRVVVAGPGTAKDEFLDYLSDDLKKRVIGKIDVDFDEKEVLPAAEEAVTENREYTLVSKLEAFKKEVLRDGLAVYGVKEAVDAARNGQINTLFVLKGLKIKGWVCERCQVVEPGNIKVCPYCGKPTSEVDVVEEIIEFAERTDAETEFVDDDETLKDLGGVGGLLRFK
ncbi:MAG: hypothetical protein DRN01_00280 [Thermoplasmata archaeon]|nr:MAG: hypothetical protein DRN01_00280 [Thermoplasmata archaeon]